MSPRVQAQTIQKRFRTPRIPFLLSRFDFAFKALTKGFSLFDQSFFITRLEKLTYLFGIVISELIGFKKFFPQYYNCFPTSVF